MKKNGTLERLRFLFQIARKKRSGILAVRGGSEPRNFYIDDGQLKLVSGPDSAAYFAGLLEEQQVVKPRRLARAIKNRDQSGGFLLAHLVDLGYAQREDLVELLDHIARKDLTRLVDDPDGATRASWG